MPNFWNIEGIPHKGWALKAVYDVREGGQSEDETAYETCMMCNNERIRYVHVLTHENVPHEFKVGCVCAEKMTNDYENPKRLENELRSNARKRIQWVKRIWNISANGNHYLNFELHHLLIYRDKKTNKFKCKIGEIFGQKSFDKLEQAKNAIFTGINYLKERQLW
ncbi:MAG: hypothetical protein ABI707_18070 [Ferruginibacter sp.]